MSYLEPEVKISSSLLRESRSRRPASNVYNTDDTANTDSSTSTSTIIAPIMFSQDNHKVRPSLPKQDLGKPHPNFQCSSSYVFPKSTAKSNSTTTSASYTNSAILAPVMLQMMEDENDSQPKSVMNTTHVSPQLPKFCEVCSSICSCIFGTRKMCAFTSSKKKTHNRLTRCLMKAKM